MKNRITKILLSSVLSEWLIAWTVFALNTVNTGETLTAASWNALVDKVNYLDATVSATPALQPWTIDWRDCEYKNGSPNANIACTSWYALVHSTMYQVSGNGGISLNGTNSIHVAYSNYGTIKCCKINQ